jgi:hypothetical protein
MKSVWACCGYSKEVEESRLWLSARKKTGGGKRDAADSSENKNGRNSWKSGEGKRRKRTKEGSRNIHQKLLSLQITDPDSRANGLARWGKDGSPRIFSGRIARTSDLKISSPRLEGCIP